MAKISKTPEQLKQDYLSNLRAGLANVGLTNPNTSSNSAWNVQAETDVSLVLPVYNNLDNAIEEGSPDTATGANLDRIAKNEGLTRKPASQSFGAVQLLSSQPTLIPAGSELVAPTGTRFRVEASGIYNNLQTIPIRSVSGGANANLSIDTVLKWVATPAYAESNAKINVATSGGADPENDEDLRSRILDKKANPAAAGNWQHVIQLAEGSDPIVQKAYCYPAAGGPSTVHCAVLQRPSVNSKTREIDSFKLNSIIAPTVQGYMPEGVQVTTTTVQDLEVDIAFELEVPLAVGATSAIGGPDGTGNGWIDAAPFPRVDGTTVFYSGVFNIVNDTSFRIQSIPNSPPVRNITRISWIDRLNGWEIKTATIVASTEVFAGFYDIAIDVPFVGIEENDFVFPAVANAKTYLAAVLNSFSQLGPGQKTLAAGVIDFAKRKPPVSNSTHPSNIDSHMLSSVIRSSEEVLNCNYMYRGTSTSLDQVPTSEISPPLPYTISQGPFVFIPRRIGFYPKFPL